MIWCSFVAAALRLARIETASDRRLAAAILLSTAYLIGFAIRRLLA